MNARSPMVRCSHQDPYQRHYQPARQLCAGGQWRIRSNRKAQSRLEQQVEHLKTLDAVDYHVTQLEQVFEPIARNYGGRIRLSFSGGQIPT